MIINSNLKKLSKTYLFTKVTEKVENYKKSNPGVKLINLGIGDYTLPLCDAVVEKLKKAEEAKKAAAAAQAQVVEGGNK